MSAEIHNERGKVSIGGMARLGVGLIQGVAVWLLSEASDGAHKLWPATQPILFAALVMVALLAALPLLGVLGKREGGGRAGINIVVIWPVVAALVVAGLAAYDLWRGGGFSEDRLVAEPQTWIFASVWLFVAHHLVTAADADGKPIARYPTYFDMAWKHAVQLALSAAFVGVFWILLTLGAQLFKVIGLDFFTKLIGHTWFWMPVTTMAFAVAVQITDVRVNLIRGIRTVGLILLSWLLPLMALIAGGFLVALVFTGLKPLWNTGHAGALLLTAAGALIVLINAAYQDGGVEHTTPLPLRWAVRLAALLLAPIVGLAAYALALRIGQYGLTPERIIAAACTLVGVCYAVGYGIAAVMPGTWMKRLEPTNVITAVIVLVVILALFSPIADPARLAVGDQVKRLESGKVAVDKFDFKFLRFRSARFGREALDRLAVKPRGPNAAAIATAAQAAIALTSPFGEPQVVRSKFQADQLTVFPKGKVLPESFYSQVWDERAPFDPCRGQQACDAIVVDLNGDGVDEVLVGRSPRRVYGFQSDGRWSSVGTIDRGSAEVVDEALKAGRFKVVQPKWKAIEAVGEHLEVTPDDRDIVGGEDHPER